VDDPLGIVLTAVAALLVTIALETWRLRRARKRRERKERTK
jgi:cytochrome oxidase assembly protein ShyY1